MNCPSCNTRLEPGARFCGVCGHRLDGSQARDPNPQAAGRGKPGLGPPAAGTPASAAAQRPIVPQRAASPRPGPGPGVPKVALAAKPKPPEGDPYVGHTLNGRFRVDSKIGEGGFGAVYRGVQLATGRKVALKLLHPEMTNDENLVARFRREGLVLCNLRDAHTITTYDFDQTPDGTLYIAMELLEGRSLHQVFHDEAPIDWKRMFKILAEMCSSLAEAHTHGIVHRDLKPENIYLENRPGNPEFVKILDFGIAKVMRGEGSMDPQAPQLTATGQTLGTLEYMSPEQLMGKQLDGRSDVYALGVLAYEMITGQLPFPNAKGPAGLITAQLKQTPKPPSSVNPGALIPPAVDKVVLRCLEKDKNNRFPDVTQLSVAAQDALADATVSSSKQIAPSPDVLATQRGQPENMHAPPSMPLPVAVAREPQRAVSPALGVSTRPGPGGGPAVAAPIAPYVPPPPVYPDNGGYPPSRGGSTPVPAPTPVAGSQPSYAAGGSYSHAPAVSKRWIWFALALLALGALTGAALAYLL